MSTTKEQPNNKIANFPQEVIDKMLERQFEQIGIRNIINFQANKMSNKNQFGFDCDNTIEGDNFWHSVIYLENFDVFFKKYPKSKPYPKMMYVGDSEKDVENKLTPRWVIAEHAGIFVAISGAKSKEAAMNMFDLVLWKYAKDIEPEPILPEYTIEDLQEKLGHKFILNLKK